MDDSHSHHFGIFMTQFGDNGMLSQAEREAFIKIIFELAHVSDKSQLLHCLSYSFQSLLPHEVMIIT